MGYSSVPNKRGVTFAFFGIFEGEQTVIRYPHRLAKFEKLKMKFKI